MQHSMAFHNTYIRTGNTVHVRFVYSELVSHLALWLGTNAQVPDSRLVNWMDSKRGVESEGNVNGS